MSTQMKCGPSGGIGGEDFEDICPPQGKKISEITVWYEDVVEAIQIAWSGDSSSDKHGRGDDHPTPITLDEDEYLIGISGRYGVGADSISFVTTKNTYGPYGGDGGDVEYFYNVDPASPQAHIIGFCGRAGDAIDAIGCIFSVEK